MKWLLLLVIFRPLHILAQAAPTVLSSPGLSVTQSEKLRLLDLSIMISPGLITVDYLLQNTSENDIKTNVSFTTSPMKNKKHDENFSVFVDGDREEFETSLLASGSDEKSKDHLQKFFDWKQIFPSEKLIRISYSYDPTVTEVEFKRIDHEKLWTGYLKTDSPNKDLKVRFIGYHLSNASKWKRGIEQFNLMVTGSEIIMAEVDGKIYGDLGVLKISQTKIEPTKDILVEFIDPTDLKPNSVSLNLPLIEDAPCLANPNGKTTRDYKKSEIVIVSKRKNFWLFVEKDKCWIHQSGFR